MKLLPHARNPRAGFSLAEVLLSVAILGSLLGVVAMVQTSGQKLTASATLRTQANLKAARLADRVVQEVTMMNADGANPNPTTSLGTDSITFQKPAGVAGGAATWNTAMRLQQQLSVGELDNGLDDDGDGLTDERALVLTYDVGAATERSAILGDNLRELWPGETINVLDDNGNGVVDERGFNLRRVGDVMQVRVCVELAGRDGETEIAVVETSVKLRN
jgi:prepilin-type N-terminal cleavage/methylation domain-containing protein